MTAHPTRSATYPDRETAQWATQQVVTANEQLIHRWLAQSTRSRLDHRGRVAVPGRPGRPGPAPGDDAGGPRPRRRTGRPRHPQAGRREPHGFAVHATFPVYL